MVSSLVRARLTLLLLESQLFNLDLLQVSLNRVNPAPSPTVVPIPAMARRLLASSEAASIASEKALPRSPWPLVSLGGSEPEPV